MNKSIYGKIKFLERILDYHSYMVEPNEKPNKDYTIPSIIETLEIALREKDDNKLSVPDIVLPFRDVIETLHQINQLFYCDEKGEIDFDFFATNVHLPISFDISVISKYLLDCHIRFKSRKKKSDILMIYAWLLGEVWHYVLCQDTNDLWCHTIWRICEKKQYIIDADLYELLFNIIPLEMR